MGGDHVVATDAPPAECLEIGPSPGACGGFQVTSVLTAIKRVFVRSGAGVRVVHECRNCGTTVDADSTECPACSSTGIVRYEIR